MGIKIWYDSKEEDLAIKENTVVVEEDMNKMSMNYVTRSGRAYQPGERELINGK